MNQFLKNFLRDAPEKLAAMRRATQALSELLPLLQEHPSGQTRMHQLLRQIFQQTHTLKGSAAAFGLETVRTLTHEIENLLDRLRSGELVCDRTALGALDIGIKNIEIALSCVVREKKVAAPPKDLLLKINFLNRLKSKKCGDERENELPTEFAEKLNKREKEHLQKVVSSGATLFVASLEFPVAQLKTKLQSLRSELETSGEIVAVLPGAALTSTSIALQIVFGATVATAALLNFPQYIELYGGKIVFDGRKTNSFAEAAATALFAGQRIATELGKEIEFEIFGGGLKISKKQADSLATALLHLIVNAVVHGIEDSQERLAANKQPRGIVRIAAQQKADLICVGVADDGRGIDFASLARAADEDSGFKLDSEKNDLTLAQNLIFAPGFSTAETISQVAGRGIGLDATKSAVESVNGAIKVKSEVGRGTIFEISLPQT